MRYGIIVAAAALALPATGAQAEEWCGYTARDNAVIECGYTTASDCQGAVGKGGTCFVDPDIALNTKRATPVLTAKLSTNHS
jgi:hypothetical protein